MRTGRSRRTEDADTVDEGGAAAARVSEWKAAAMRTSGRERAAQPCLPLDRGARRAEDFGEMEAAREG